MHRRPRRALAVGTPRTSTSRGLRSRPDEPGPLCSRSLRCGRLPRTAARSARSRRPPLRRSRPSRCSSLPSRLCTPTTRAFPRWRASSSASCPAVIAIIAIAAYKLARTNQQARTHAVGNRGRCCAATAGDRRGDHLVFIGACLCRDDLSRRRHLRRIRSRLGSFALLPLASVKGFAGSAQGTTSPAECVTSALFLRQEASTFTFGSWTCGRPFLHQGLDVDPPLAHRATADRRRRNLVGG